MRNFKCFYGTRNLLSCLKNFKIQSVSLRSFTVFMAFRRMSSLIAA